MLLPLRKNGLDSLFKEVRVFKVADVRALGKLNPREVLCAVGAHRSYLVEAPELHKTIPDRKPV